MPEVAGELRAVGVDEGVTPDEIVAIAFANIGIEWSESGCAAFVSGVTNLAGAPFFSQGANILNGDPTLPLDVAYKVPHSPGKYSGVDNIAGDGWVPVDVSANATALADALQPGDVVRVYLAGNSGEHSLLGDNDFGAHSFIVTEVNGDQITVVDNWNGTTIDEHSYWDIVAAFAPNGYFQAAFVSRIDQDWVDENIPSTLQGNGVGNVDWEDLVEVSDQDDNLPYGSSFFLDQGSTYLVGTIPAGAEDVYIDLSSDTDLDLQLWDGDTPLVGWDIGALLSDEDEDTIWYEGVEITYSGYDGDGTGSGEEFIIIHGVVPDDFEIVVSGFEAGAGEVGWTANTIPTDTPSRDTDDESPSSSTENVVEFSVGEEDTQMIGTIPAGTEYVYIDLSSNSDIDLQLWDGATALVGWGIGALLSDEDEDTIWYEGVEITYSGYNGDGTGSGEEYIVIEGELQSDLTIFVSGYNAGSGEVEWTADEPLSDVENGDNQSATSLVDEMSFSFGGGGSFLFFDVIPAGTDGAYIDLSADADVDLHLWHDGTSIVSFDSGDDQETFNWDGMEITYSGSDGSGGDPGEEFISIEGVVPYDLVILLYAHEASSGVVEWYEI